MNWRPQAACRGMDPDLFFPQRGESTAEAKAVCAECPVSDQCLDYALSLPPVQGTVTPGIWGATSKRQREAMRRVPA